MLSVSRVDSSDSSPISNIFELCIYFLCFWHYIPFYFIIFNYIISFINFLFLEVRFVCMYECKCFEVIRGV